ncbi:MAG TPA: hypothetical protein PLO27_06595, partial [Marmoricola sp.]|nr:hypothetical protein [Marmoricola sp.]
MGIPRTQLTLPHVRVGDVRVEFSRMGIFGKHLDRLEALVQCPVSPVEANAEGPELNVVQHNGIGDHDEEVLIPVDSDL